MNNISFHLIAAILLFLVPFSAFSQEFEEMQVKNVSKNLIVANKGKSQGVQINAVYNINRAGQIIGKAKVLLIEENLCGLKILKIQPGFFVKLGDVLIKNLSDSIKEHEKGYIYRPPKFEFVQRYPVQNYIVQGQ